MLLSPSLRGTHDGEIFCWITTNARVAGDPDKDSLLYFFSDEVQVQLTNIK